MALVGRRRGAFFPPISLENDQLGWQSFWTLTPSAINSWIGAEIRIIGVQGTLEWRRDATLSINGAIFGFNDPTGVVIADRGWNFDDRPLGLFDHYRVAGFARVRHQRDAAVRSRSVFKEIDHRPGWYLDASYEPQGSGFELMTYDNNGDPSQASGGDSTWHTRFSDLGAYHQFDGLLTVMGQAMAGDTDDQAVRRASIRKPISAPPTFWPVSIWTNGGSRHAPMCFETDT